MSKSVKPVATGTTSSTQTSLQIGAVHSKKISKKTISAIRYIYNPETLGKPNVKLSSMPTSSKMTSYRIQSHAKDMKLDSKDEKD